MSATPCGLVAERVLAVPLELELICVDDGSHDGSREILGELQSRLPNLQVLLQPKNMGKGAALRCGIQSATGDFVVIQDADLEYDPADYPNLLDPLIQGKADVSLRLTLSGRQTLPGSLLLASRGQPVADFAFQLPDQHQPIQAIPIEENRFGFEPEITVKVGARNPGSCECLGRSSGPAPLQLNR